MEIKRLLEQDTVRAAEQLLGWELVRKTRSGEIRIRITETEAYKGKDDPASHACRGITPRNRLMFGNTGILYVYLIYGMYHCMNIIAHEPGEAGAVLIRAGQAIDGIELIRQNRPGVADKQLLNGPGKLAKGLDIDLKWNGYNLLRVDDPDDCLFLEYRKREGSVRCTPRIGISKGTDLPWRFVLEP
jgi:DNA-3-methyladenine glycosylase